MIRNTTWIDAYKSANPQKERDMEKINIAELLKDCPRGMELDCMMYENVTLIDVYEGCNFPIRISTPEGTCRLSQYGCYALNKEAKCVIFPKGKTTWEGFQRPFKDGDVVATSNGNHIFIFKENAVNEGGGFSGVCYFGYEIPKNKLFREGKWRFSRLATEEEKQKLFDAIKDNGYKWNPETKTLEKLIISKFKVGDRIRHKSHISQENVITEIKDTHYILDDETALPFVFQDEYELVPYKFDINTLNPFDKVLVRDNNEYCWHATFYSHHTGTYFYSTNGLYAQCIPFEDNKHLLGTTNDCDDFYKTWEG